MMMLSVQLRAKISRKYLKNVRFHVSRCRQSCGHHRWPHPFAVHMRRVHYTVPGAMRHGKPTSACQRIAFKHLISSTCFLDDEDSGCCRLLELRLWSNSTRRNISPFTSFAQNSFWYDAPSCLARACVLFFLARFTHCMFAMQFGLFYLVFIIFRHAFFGLRLSLLIAHLVLCDCVFRPQ